MSNGISLKDFQKAFAYTKTESGPVKPARTTTVKMMKGTLGPVGDQTRKDWDHRTYENKSLLMDRNYLSLKDIGIKIMTEATSSTSYSPMRLNLSGMDMDQASLNGEFSCNGVPVTINLKYPNAHNAISVELSLKGGRSMLYDVALDSDQFQGNFAQSIRENAKNLIQQENETSLDDLSYGIGAVKTPGNDFNDTLGVANSDTNNITAYESVDWRLQKLLDVCNDTVAMFEARGDFGPDDFSAPPDGSTAPGATTDPNAPPVPNGADGTEHPQNAGDVNGVTDGNGDGDSMMEFREFVLPSDPDNGSGLSQAAWDNLAQIVADAINYINDNQSGGVKPSATEWYEGFPGVKNMIPDEILEQFLSFDDYKALDTVLPIKGLQQFAHALEGGKVDVTKFKTDLGKWFPEVYNTDGTAMHDVAKEAAAMTFPEDDFAPAGNGGLDMDSTVNFGGAGEMGDLMDSAQEQFGPMGGMDAGEMNAGIDMSENGNAAEGGGKDKTDLAIESLDNLF